MTKLKINTKTIQDLNPCQDRLDNWLKHYKNVSFDLKSFLGLENITHRDKLWVILRLISNETKVIFALDCTFAAYAIDFAYAIDAADAFADVITTTAYSTYATYVAADIAIIAAHYADIRKLEESRQIEALIYLIEGEV